MQCRLQLLNESQYIRIIYYILQLYENQLETKVIFDHLTSLAQDWMHYFDTRGRDNPLHNISSRSHHQEAIQFRASDNVIDRDYGWGSKRTSVFAGRHVSGSAITLLSKQLEIKCIIN